MQRYLYIYYRMSNNYLSIGGREKVKQLHRESYDVWMNVKAHVVLVNHKNKEV